MGVRKWRGGADLYAIGDKGKVEGFPGAEMPQNKCEIQEIRR